MSNAVRHWFKVLIGPSEKDLRHGVILFPSEKFGLKSALCAGAINHHLPQEAFCFLKDGMWGLWSTDDVILLHDPQPISNCNYGPKRAPLHLDMGSNQADETDLCLSHKLWFNVSVV